MKGTYPLKLTTFSKEESEIAPRDKAEHAEWLEGIERGEMPQVVMEEVNRLQERGWYIFWVERRYANVRVSDGDGWCREVKVVTWEILAGENIPGSGSKNENVPFRDMTKLCYA